MTTQTKAKNVLREPLQVCCMNPLTGFYRTGSCESGLEDLGLHLVCAQMTDEFLEFSKAKGNDLSTPAPHFGFSGLKAGDCWCLCVQRWKEAYEHGMAPKVKVQSTHISALEFVELENLLEYAIDYDHETPT